MLFILFLLMAFAYAGGAANNSAPLNITTADSPFFVTVTDTDTVTDYVTVFVTEFSSSTTTEFVATTSAATFAPGDATSTDTSAGDATMTSC